MYAITAPGFDGKLPEGVVQIKAPSELIGVVGRTAVNADEPADVKKAKEVLASYQVGGMHKFYPDFPPKQVDPINFPPYSDEDLLNEKKGIYANTPFEAFYPVAQVDSENNILDGNKNYALTFPAGQLPPVKYFCSLTIYIGHAKPKQGTGNWLPAPKAEFNVMMRLYGPKQTVLDGAWAPPAIVPIK